MRKNHILLISDNQEIINEILTLFKNTNIIFHVINDKEYIIKIFKKNVRIDFIIIDNNSYKYDTIELIKKLKKINNKIAILILSEYITDSLKDQLSKYNFINIFSLKNSKYEIKYNTLNYLISLKTAKLNIEVSKFLIMEKRIYKIPNSLKYVGPISEQLTRNLVEVGLINKDDLYNIKFGIQEMIINAIEHGNLEISYEEKTEFLKQEMDINKIIDNYSKKDKFKNRKVVIKYYLTKDRVTYIIKDQGNGFDWRKIPDSINETNALLEHGRGIMMTKNYFDEFYYNKKGNQVTMIIYKKNN